MPFPPPLTPEEREAQRAERHRRWKAMLTDRDWELIRALAREVTGTYCPARLEGLAGGKLAVGVCWPGREDRWSGERIGTLRTEVGDVPVLVWEMQKPPA